MFTYWLPTARLNGKQHCLDKLNMIERSTGTGGHLVGVVGRVSQGQREEKRSKVEKMQRKHLFHPTWCAKLWK